LKDTGGYIRDAKELQVMQSYPLWMKVMLTKQRIREWVYQFGEDGVVVSFSGGKDSTVLLHLVREEFPNVKAVFSNTGLEYPEIQRFVKSFDNVDIVTPSVNFGEVISTYGYPLIGKEVAEAIHYARRIRSQTGNVERERERADNPPQDSRAARSPNLIETSSAANRRTILQGQWGKKPTGNDWNSGGAEPTYHPDGMAKNRNPWEEDAGKDKGRRKSNQSRDSQWRDWRRGCL